MRIRCKNVSAELRDSSARPTALCHFRFPVVEAASGSCRRRACSPVCVCVCARIRVRVCVSECVRISFFYFPLRAVVAGLQFFSPRGPPRTGVRVCVCVCVCPPPSPPPSLINFRSAHARFSSNAAYTRERSSLRQGNATNTGQRRRLDDFRGIRTRTVDTRPAPSADDDKRRPVRPLAKFFPPLTVL